MIYQPPSRRRFLQYSAGGALAIGVDASLPQCFVNAAANEQASSERVLVVVQLSGGNDGLNTVVPHSDDAYRGARPNLAIPTSQLISIDDNLALHPSLRTTKDLLDDGTLTVVQGVGYENPNRSHFESMDIWHTCLRKDQQRISGWLGRLLESYPETDGGDVPGLHLGHQQQPFALASESVRVPTVKQIREFQLHGSDADSLRQLLRETPPSTLSAGESPDELLSFLRTSTQNALSASQRVTEAAEGYQTEVRYPDSGLAEKFKMIAQLIDAGLQTRIYYVQLDGFDTHAQQPDAHAVLLREWSEAVSAFVEDITAHDHLDRVCVMTFSEFGRRVAENASDGTDHGAAGPMFLCGGGLSGGVIGDTPSLTDLQQGDLKHNIDFRSVYATVLKDWLGADPEAIVGGRYEMLPIFDV